MEDKKASNANLEIQNEWDETIPAWQIDLVMSELQNLANGNAGLMNWEEAIKTYKL